jgi:hypothetical protein
MNELSSLRVKDLRAYIDSHRREPNGSLDTKPLPGNNPHFDWGAAGLNIDFAKHHLDEGLPNGQLLRVRASFMLMRQGVEELAVWLRAKGVDV